MRRSSVIPIGAILVLALVLRVAVVAATPHFKPIFDAVDYDGTARSLAAGHGYHGGYFPGPHPTAYRPPLYPFALAPVYALGGGWTAGRILGAVLGVAIVLLLFLIADRVSTRRVALCTAGIAAVYPPLVLWSATLLTEPLFIVLVLAGTLAALQYRRRPGFWWAVAAGVACGLAALTRANGILLVLPLALGVWTSRTQVRREALRAAAVLCVAAAITCVPWVVRNSIEFHRFVGITDQAGYALAGTYNRESAHARHPGEPMETFQVPSLRDIVTRRDLDEVQVGSRLTKRGLNYISDHPGYVFEASAWNTLRVFDAVHDADFKRAYQAVVLEANGLGSLVGRWILVTIYALFVLAVAGAVVVWRLPGPNRPPMFIWAIPVVLMAPAVVIWGLSRYRAPVDPFLILLAAFAVAEAPRRVRDYTRSRRA